MDPKKCEKFKAEETFCQAAEAHDWIIDKQNWPSFVCKKGNKVILVEVKKKNHWIFYIEDKEQGEEGGGERKP